MLKPFRSLAIPATQARTERCPLGPLGSLRAARSDNVGAPTLVKCSVIRTMQMGQKARGVPELERSAWYLGQGLFMSPPCPPAKAITLPSTVAT